MLEFVQRNHDHSPDRGLYRYDVFDDLPEFLSYGEVPERVAACADFFREQGIGPGTRVLFPFETSAAVILSFLGLMEAGAVPLSVKPLLMGVPKAEYEKFLTQVGHQFHAACLLRTPSLAGVDVPLADLALPPEGIRRRSARLRTPADDELAFVQFSSGSTASPKGIPVRQGALRANLTMITRTDGRRPEERISSWLPLYHDMGLVGGLLSCLRIGGDLLLADPWAFLSDARGWWQHLAAERVAGTVIPNFAIDFSLKQLRAVDPERLAEMDLSALRSVYLGSEPINVANLHSLLDLMAPARLRRNVFMPCYGLAEAVLLVSSRPPGTDVRITASPSGVPAISLGRPMTEFALRLRGEAGRVCGDHELGEVELAGGSLATTYLDSSVPLVAEDGYYRTGDIGFVADGELFITGRIGDRMKINGQSYFASDFEQALERLPFVQDGRTAVIETHGQIVVLAVVDRAARADAAGSRAQIVEHLLRTVGVMVQPENVHFVPAARMRRTSSGKLRRRAIAEEYERERLSDPAGR